jgi:hypothetical protein
MMSFEAQFKLDPNLHIESQKLLGPIAMVSVVSALVNIVFHIEKIDVIQPQLIPNKDLTSLLHVI